MSVFKGGFYDYFFKKTFFFKLANSDSSIIVWPDRTNFPSY